MNALGKTDVGLRRHENQDTFAVETIGKSVAAVVCDGMGGAEGGQIASTLAVETFMKELRALLREDMSMEQLRELASFCVAQANTAVYQRSIEDEDCRGMGTTLVSAVAGEKGTIVCNVGDSRAYLISREGIRQISKDHSLVENMVDHGELTPQQARKHPSRNLITRALGPEAAVQADTFPVQWKQGDFLLLCSDGLVNTVTDQEILFEVIHGGALEECLQRLLALSRQRGAPDNVTAILLMNI